MSAKEELEQFLEDRPSGGSWDVHRAWAGKVAEFLGLVYGDEVGESFFRIRDKHLSVVIERQCGMLLGLICKAQTPGTSAAQSADEAHSASSSRDGERVAQDSLDGREEPSSCEDRLERMRNAYTSPKSMFEKDPVTSQGKTENIHVSRARTSVPIDVLTPQEYLEHLQAEKYGNDFSPFHADVGDVLTANLVGALPAEHRQQLESIAIGVLPTRSVNAWVMRVPSGGEVIGFDFGAMSFMLMLNKILVSRINMFRLDPVLDFKSAADLATTTVKSFFCNEEMPRFTVSPRRILIASSLSNIQTAFIVGHEIGHVLLRHLRHHTGADLAELPHDQEFAADARGTELVLASFQRSHDPLFGSGHMPLSQAAIDLFFTYLVFMEKVLPKPEGIQSSSHPSSEDRRTALRTRFWEDLSEEAKSLAQEAEKTFDAFEKLLDSGV